MDNYNGNCETFWGKEDEILGKSPFNPFKRTATYLLRDNLASLFQRISFVLESFQDYFSIHFLFKNLPFISLIFLASIVIFSNFKERSLVSSFLDEKFYTQNEVENFVTSVSPYTPILEEEPALTAETIAVDGSAESQEFLERPELATTLPSDLEPTQKPVERRQIITYTVVSGDTLSKIAIKFSLSLKTVADANNLSSVNQIKPGQSLSIPPVDGVIHTVAKGETLSGLVKKYQGNLTETLKYNPETIQIAQKIVIVGGKVTAPTSSRLASSRNVLTRSGTSGRVLGAGGNRNNGYPWGWCTWYAAYRRNIPRNWGNAGRWLASARASGYATSSVPSAGAIIVTRESWWGHVGYVEAVHGDSVTISEMNYERWGVINRRTISRYDSVIKGYIY